MFRKKHFNKHVWVEKGKILFLVLEYSVERDQGPCTFLSGLRTLKKN